MKNKNLYEMYVRSLPAITYAKKNNLFREYAYPKYFPKKYMNILCNVLAYMGCTAKVDGFNQVHGCVSHKIFPNHQCGGWSCTICQLHVLSELFKDKDGVEYG